MRGSQRALGLLMTGMAIVILYTITVVIVPSSCTEPLTIVSGYILALFLPGLVIDLLFAGLSKGSQNDISSKCGGLHFGGYLIGYAERSLIFLAVTIAYFDSALTYASILSFLSVIVAGKAIFRYSSKDISDRACADWYILGTLMSITMALALAWWLFRFMLLG